MGRRRGSRVPGEPLPRPAEVVPACPGVAAGLSAQLEAFRTSLDQWPGALYQLGDAELGAFVGEMLGLARRAETLAAVAITDAVDRGVVACWQAVDATGWVATEAAAGLGVDPAVVRRVGFVANACTDPRNHVIFDALAAGAVTTECAKATLRQLPEVLPLLPGADRDEVTSWYLALTDHGSSAMKELTARVMGRFAPEVLEHLEERQQACESLTMKDLSNGLVELVAHLSRGHAATVKHAIEALSAPDPARCPAADETTSVTPGADIRTPGKRRADAFLQLVDTGARAIDEGRPAGATTGGATVIVTVDHDTLIDQLNQVGARSHLPGIGRTSHGDLIDAGTVRQMACNATLIPMVLGSQSEPLDVGRAKRLFTGGLRTAIAHRDKGCTYPGCHRPPDWCDAHHIAPWWAGGTTNLANAALLCARHHTIVHRDHLTATVTTTGVTWDTTPGRMASGAA